MLKKLWNDSVWSNVIAGTILAVGALLGAYFLDWWPTIGRFTKDAYNFSLSPTSLSNWIIGVLGLLAAPTIIVLLAMIWQTIFPSSATTATDWRNYTTDKFSGLRWRWRYRENGQIYSVYTFCPHCDFQVYAKDISTYRAVDRIEFSCDSCGKRLGEFAESSASLESKVERFIQQKIEMKVGLPRTRRVQ